MRSVAILIFANGLSVNPTIGLKATSDPNLLGVTKLSVTRGGFVFVEAQTFITFDSEIESSSPRFLSSSESPQSYTSSSRSQTSFLMRRYPNAAIATEMTMKMGSCARAPMTMNTTTNPNQSAGNTLL